MSRRAVLVVDDDVSIRSYVSQLLSARGYLVETADSGEQAIARLASGLAPSVIVLDMIMPRMNGREVLVRLRDLCPTIPVIMLSGMGQIKTVVEAMRMGAADYLVKPFEDQELELAIDNALEKHELREEVKNLKRQLDQAAEYEWIGANARMLRLKEMSRQVADADVPLLILGESGVGKEVVARFIHANSRRRDKPFIKVNCAALPNDLLESELFGYERGAFTGAMVDKPGKFELADKGTIVLDEIAEMSPHLQAKLLHVLQDGEYSRLGGKRAVRADARVIALTNRKLNEYVAKGDFREDLYFRLNVIRMEVPPLRERKEDIPFLCTYFLQKYLGKYNTTVQELPKELLDAFMQYDWPGNIRQFENAIKRYLILPDVEMAVADLNEAPIANTHALAAAARPAALAPVLPFVPPQRNTAPEGISLKDVGAQAAESAEREVVLRVLDETNWNRKQAARRLGICYKALLNKLKKWQIESRGGSLAARSV